MIWTILLVLGVAVLLYAIGVAIEAWGEYKKWLKEQEEE